MAQRRNYYRDGQEQLWRIAPGAAPRLYTAEDGWRPLQIWGMGIASQDLTGDGYPEVFLTSQGDNKLQTLDGRAARPTYRRHRARSAASPPQRPFTGGDVLPSTAWHPEFADVNNDGFVDLFITKGNVEAQVDYARRDPSNLLLGQARRHVRRGRARTPASSDFDRGRGAALVDLNLDGMLDLVVVNRRRERQALAQRRPRATPQRPARDGPLARAAAAASPARTSTPSARGWRCGSAIGASTREVTVGGGHAGGQLGWIHVGLGDGEPALRCACSGPTARPGRGWTVAADQFVTIERGDRGQALGAGGSATMTLHVTMPPRRKHSGLRRDPT